MPLHVDGEPRDTARQFNIRVIPACFKLIQPWEGNVIKYKVEKTGMTLFFHRLLRTDALSCLVAAGKT